MGSQIFFRTVIRSWLTLNCVQRLSQGDFLCTSSPALLPARFLSLKPESRTRLLKPTCSCFPPLSFDFTLKIYSFFESFGCHALWHLLKLGSVPWLAVIIRIVRFSTFRSLDENHNCSCFQPNISLHMMLQRAQRGRSFFVYILKRKLYLWPTFQPKGLPHKGQHHLPTRSL